MMSFQNCVPAGKDLKSSKTEAQKLSKSFCFCKLLELQTFKSTRTTLFLNALVLKFFDYTAFEC